MGEVMGGEGFERAARRLRPCAGGGKPPRLFFFTDPARTPDPLRVAARLPKGAAVVYRAFGRPEALEAAGALRTLTRRRGVLLLIGEDEALAAAVDADGLHLAERSIARAPRLRARWPRWLLTGAVHSARALHAAGRAGVDVAVLSSVFDSRSPSAGRPLGPLRFAMMVRESSVPVIALGGVTPLTARRLQDSGAAGFAAVAAWLEP
jgi:thiamine-phosphate pyrophosphorylase